MPLIAAGSTSGRGTMTERIRRCRSACTQLVVPSASKTKTGGTVGWSGGKSVSNTRRHAGEADKRQRCWKLRHHLLEGRQGKRPRLRLPGRGFERGDLDLQLRMPAEQRGPECVGVGLRRLRIQSAGEAEPAPPSRVARAISRWVWVARKKPTTEWARLGGLASAGNRVWRTCQPNTARQPTQPSDDEALPPQGGAAADAPANSRHGQCRRQ